MRNYVEKHFKPLSLVSLARHFILRGGVKRKKFAKTETWLFSQKLLRSAFEIIFSNEPAQGVHESSTCTT